MTTRIAMFGIATATMGLIGGSVLSGEMTTYFACVLMGALAILFTINRTIDRLEHLRQLQEIEDVEASFLARTIEDNVVWLPRPERQPARGGRLQ